jgi:hypothetical protein
VNWRARADRLRTLPLPVVLAALEATPDPHDPAKWRTARGVLSVRGPKFINWNLDIGGGGAIDLVMHLRQVGFGQAMEWLELHFGTFLPRPPQATLQAQSLSLPTPVADNWPRVQHYLVQERKLPATLLEPLVRSGAIYADARANAVFLLLDTAANPVGAELRGTTSLGWRGMAPVASSPCPRSPATPSFSASPLSTPSVAMPFIPITAVFPPPAPGLTRRGLER